MASLLPTKPGLRCSLRSSPTPAAHAARRHSYKSDATQAPLQWGMFRPPIPPSWSDPIPRPRTPWQLSAATAVGSTGDRAGPQRVLCEAAPAAKTRGALRDRVTAPSFHTVAPTRCVALTVRVGEGWRDRTERGAAPLSSSLETSSICNGAGNTSNGAVLRVIAKSGA